MKFKFGKLPPAPGVYVFKKGRQFLYIGKASNIRERVKQHQTDPLFRQTKNIGYIRTDSEIEALILEAELIKKYRPKYNVVWRDDKGFFYVGITKEELPRIFITHQTRSLNTKSPLSTHSKIQDTRYIGPFTDGKALKKTLRFIRKIFPYYTLKKHPKLPCTYCHLDLCPGPNPDSKEYRRNIKNLVSVLKGKRKSVARRLKKEMILASKNKNFERAAKIRDQIQSLENIFAHAKLFEDKISYKFLPWQQFVVKRIEGYDVSNIQGQWATASMVTFVNGKPEKNLYRKFKIKISGKPNDTAMIRETIRRRLAHPEWGYPEAMLIDGGEAQLNAALSLKSKILSLKSVKIMALAKKKNELFIEGRKEPILLKDLPEELSNLILHVRDEAHRFARKYHLQLRAKALLSNN